MNPRALVELVKDLAWEDRRLKEKYLKRLKRLGSKVGKAVKRARQVRERERLKEAELEAEWEARWRAEAEVVQEAQ